MNKILLVEREEFENATLKSWKSWNNFFFLNLVFLTSTSWRREPGGSFADAGVVVYGSPKGRESGFSLAEPTKGTRIKWKTSCLLFPKFFTPNFKFKNSCLNKKKKNKS